MREGTLRPLLGLVVLALFAATAAQVQAAPAAEEPQQQLAPTYRIFATREGLVGHMTANGHIIRPRDRFVALPSWSVLSPKGSDKFRVRVTYKGRSVVAPVWDVGPWNTKDDYWSPNRRYRDLPVGMPMAQAARLEGYNGGRDERGRRILLPNGIDIADGTFWDDLQMTRDDWVEVSFLWLGADPGPGPAVAVSPQPVAPAPPPAPAAPPAKPVEVEPGAVAVDDGAAGYVPQGQPWSEAPCGMGGKHAWTGSTTNPAKATASAAWAPQLPGPGFYELLAYIPECGGAATTSARYRVTHDGTVTEVTLDQQAKAGTWASLGVFHFGGQPASPPRVELGDLTADNGRAVRYDAMAWAPRTDAAPPDTRVVEIRRKDNGYQITWGGADNMSGIATYDVQVRMLPNGGWTDWKRAVSDTGAWWGPDEGKHFAFRARGKDWAGNQEPWPEGADMDTTQATP
ncbi:MAG TPA: hypothetical protein PKD53_31795 [Chloroflexaceae bacterium]|nr:hypothetical protein [Chloroflexaceae bacterium]